MGSLFWGFHGILLTGVLWDPEGGACHDPADLCIREVVLPVVEQGVKLEGDTCSTGIS